MVSGCDFPRKTPKSVRWRSNRIQGFGARGRFLTQKPENGSGSVKNISKTNGFEVPFSTPSRSRVKTTFILVTLWGTLGTHFHHFLVTRRFPLNALEQENAFCIVFVWLFAPKKLCIWSGYSLSICAFPPIFKCTRFLKKSAPKSVAIRGPF